MNNSRWYIGCTMYKYYLKNRNQIYRKFYEAILIFFEALGFDFHRIFTFRFLYKVLYKLL